MPITNLDPQAPDRFLAEMVERTERAIMRNLSYAGEECVNVARQSHTYRDQTGNLTSSVGYVISKDGHLVKAGDFNTVKQGGQGSRDGKEYAKQLVSEFPQGIVLIVVAGMNYAAHVSNRGYDVIDSAELKANQIVPVLLAQLRLKQ